MQLNNLTEFETFKLVWIILVKLPDVGAVLRVLEKPFNMFGRILYHCEDNINKRVHSVLLSIALKELKEFVVKQSLEELKLYKS